MANLDESQLKALTQIVQSAALKDTPEDQIAHILDRLSEALDIDVCSLYSKMPDENLQLIASHGLNNRAPVIIPKQQGLIGKVIASGQSLNITEPSDHPEYYYVPTSDEDRLHSYCGVPIFSSGDVSGAVVVQSRESKLLSSEQLALLSTLAIHLGLLLGSMKQRLNLSAETNVSIQGISGAPGLAIGRVHAFSAPDLSSVARSQISDPEKELKRWQELKVKGLEALNEERDLVKEELGESLASVVDAYKLMLSDPSFNSQVVDEIQRGACIPWALKTSVEVLSEAFKNMSDPYLQARHEDIEHLGQQLYELYSGDKPSRELRQTEPTILVGRSISISTISKLYSKSLKAIVCFEGAALSHISVFANALGIPAVMGVGKLNISAEQQMIVDGDTGEIILNPNRRLIAEYQRVIGERKAATSELLKNASLPATTLDGHDVQLMANSGLQSDLNPGLANGAEGVGLFRTELPFMMASSLPSEEAQEKIYGKLFNKYHDKPVYIRVLDIGSDKALAYLPAVEEENPALGLRGIRFLLNNQHMLNTQLRAILKSAIGHNQVHLIFPMISDIEQLLKCKALVEQTLEDLNNEGFEVSPPKIGIMIEVPSCISQISLWQAELDFVSIGSNDLSQYLLAIDRNNPLVGRWFDPLHPAIVHELKRIADLCSAHQLPFSLCGELAANPLAVVLLLGMGCQKLSMSAAKLPLIKHLILHSNQRDAKTVLSNALTATHASQIRELCSEYVRSLDLPHTELLLGSHESTQPHS